MARLLAEYKVRGFRLGLGRALMRPVAGYQVQVLGLALGIAFGLGFGGYSCRLYDTAYAPLAVFRVRGWSFVMHAPCRRCEFGGRDYKARARSQGSEISNACSCCKFLG
jgi:hypothetical protein